MAVITGQPPPNANPLDVPADHVACTPSDTDTYSPPFRAVIAAAAGTITIRSAISSRDVQYTVVAGQRVEVRGSMVKATGTSPLTGLVVQW